MKTRCFPKALMITFFCKILFIYILQRPFFEMIHDATKCNTLQRSYLNFSAHNIFISKVQGTSAAIPISGWLCLSSDNDTSSWPTPTLYSWSCPEWLHKSNHCSRMPNYEQKKHPGPGCAGIAKGGFFSTNLHSSDGTHLRKPESWLNMNIIPVRNWQ